MTEYELNELKTKALDYIGAIVQESEDEHEIDCASTYITLFISQLERQMKKEEAKK